MKKLAAIFSIFVGISMIGMWLMFLVTDSIPELNTIPKEVITHIIIENITALLLIGSGISLLRQSKWASNLYLFSSGMLCYTLVNSAGYYIQLEEYIFIMIFGTFLILQLMFIYNLYINK